MAGLRQMLFKAIYRDPILHGQKRDTIRRARSVPQRGSQVIACVGASRPFAVLRIENTLPVQPERLPEARREALRDYYGEIPDDLVLVQFSLCWAVEFGASKPKSKFPSRQHSSAMMRKSRTQS